MQDLVRIQIHSLPGNRSVYTTNDMKALRFIIWAESLGHVCSVFTKEGVGEPVTTLVEGE